MASMQHSKFLLLLSFLPILLPLAARGQKTTTHLHFYLHDIVEGPNPTSVKVVPPAAAPGSDLNFGDIYVIDDPLTEGPDLASKLVGRAQGTYVVASQDPNDVALLVTVNLVFAGAPYNGSTLALLSRLSLFSPVAELSVVGGSGLFRMAQGYALSTDVSDDATNSTVLELDVYVM